jgi:hypothetical protein
MVSLAIKASRSAAAMALGFAATASAQPRPPAEPVAVNVSIGPKLQAKAGNYGEREVTDLAAELKREVAHAVDHASGERPVRIDLVLQDAIPNHPTFAQLGRTLSLSLNSVGLGGARVSGEAFYADGSQRPIREQFYETDLRNELGLSTWGDADRTFSQVAYDIARGHPPAQYEGPGPTSDGNFGARYPE